MVATLVSRSVCHSTLVQLCLGNSILLDTGSVTGCFDVYFCLGYVNLVADGGFLAALLVSSYQTFTAGVSHLPVFVFFWDNY